MAKQMRIETVMHPFPHTVGVDQSLETARQMMQEHGVRHLPVQSGGELVGVISERDINFARAVDQKSAQEEKVADAFTEEAYVVTPDTPVHEVARRMAHEHLGCALVAQGGTVVGIFTTVDACSVLAELLSGELEQ